MILLLPKKSKRSNRSSTEWRIRDDDSNHALQTKCRIPSTKNTIWKTFWLSQRWMMHPHMTFTMRIFPGKMAQWKHLSQKISQLHLVCSVLNSTWLIGEWIGTFAADLNKIPDIEKQVAQIYIYHSKDDPVVPYQHSETLASLLPTATMLTFENRWHFNQPALPELLEKIQYYT